VLDGDEVPWVTKKFAGKGCSGWKMVGGTSHGGSWRQ
jgi:hypothetical protein